MIFSKILDGLGSKRAAKVTEHHALSVADEVPDVKPVGTVNRVRYLNGKLGSTGFKSGTVNMNVDGSVTPQTFCINSEKDYDIRIMQIVLFVGASSVAHKNFGNISALTNGITLLSHEAGETTPFLDAAKTGGELIAQAGMYGVFGDGATVNEILDYNAANNDVQTAVIPVAQYVPGGLRIGRGTLDKLEMTIADDLTGLTDFYCRIIGYRHYP